MSNSISTDKLLAQVNNKFLYYRAFVKRRAEGVLKHDYLVPGGPHYPEHWDWDGFFTGMALGADIPTEGVYLRNWALNYIANAKDDGRVAGTLTPKGWDPRINQMKPFLAQGAYFAGKFINDYGWLKPHWDKFKAIVTYRERNYWDKKHDLGFWYNWMESGADDNVTLILYPEKSVLATDFNTFVHREYLAMSKLAKIFGKKSDAEHFAKRAAEIKTNMNKHLWCEDAGMYCNLYLKTGEHIKRATYSTFVPLFGRIASQKQAEKTVKKYLLSAKHMNTPWGMTTLSKVDPAYNNRNIIKPYSNWQGPIWPIANYMYFQGMLNYGFVREAMDLAVKQTKMLLSDMADPSGPHENYHGETGKPLAAPNMVGWNLLIGNMLDEAINKKNPFDL